MNTTKSSKGKSAKSEPIDVEFEPAPGDEARPQSASEKTPSKPSEPSWLLLIGFAILAAVVGGMSGYSIALFYPAQNIETTTMLEARIVELETKSNNEIDLEPIEKRLDGLRADLTSRQDNALSPIVRRLEDFESQVNTIEAKSASFDRSELSAQIAEIEDAVQLVSNDIATAKSSFDQIQTMLKNERVAESVTNGNDERSTSLTLDMAAIRVEFSELSTRIRELESKPNLDTSLLEMLDLRLADLENRVSALDSGSPSSNETNVAGADFSERALALLQLSLIASTNEPFAVELSELRRVWPDVTGTNSLFGLAREGVPTIEDLIEDFPALDLRQLTGETHVYFGVLRVDNSGETGLSHKIETALKAHDLEETIRLIDQLNPKAQTLLIDWKNQLETRIHIDSWLNEISASLRQSMEG